MKGLKKIENIIKSKIENSMYTDKKEVTAAVEQGFNNSMPTPKRKTIKLVLDYRTGVAANGDCSVLVGDSADMFKNKIPSLVVQNPKLKIGGDYGAQTLDVLNKHALGKGIKFVECQGSANDATFWDNKEPMTHLTGKLGESPSSEAISFQGSISDRSNNLLSRLMDAFDAETSINQALQLKVSPTEIITWTFTVIC